MIKKIILNTLLLAGYCTADYCQSTAGTAKIYGIVKGMENDTISLKICSVLTGQDFESFEMHYYPVQNGRFAFEIKTAGKPVHFYMYSKKAIFNYLGFAEQGDSVTIDAAQLHDLKFSGTHAARFECVDKLRNSLRDFSMHHSVRINNLKIANKQRSQEIDIQDDKFSDTLAGLSLEILNKYKNKISKADYQLLQLKIMTGKANTQCAVFWNNWKEANTYPDSLERRQQLVDYYNKIEDPGKGCASYYKENVFEYIEYAIQKAKIELKIAAKNQQPAPLEAVFKKLMSYPVPLRDVLVAAYLTHTRLNHNGSDYRACLQEALDFVQLPEYHGLLLQLKATSQAKLKGTPYFNFSLENDKGKMVTLNDLRGKAVFIDYWFTGCTACVFLNRKKPEIIEAFKEEPDMVFVSINVDNDKKVWLESIATGDYACDEDMLLYTNGQGLEHPLIKYYMYNGFPEVVVLDREGKIFSAIPPRPGTKESNNELIAMLKEVLQKK